LEQLEAQLQRGDEDRAAAEDAEYHRFLQVSRRCCRCCDRLRASARQLPVCLPWCRLPPLPAAQSQLDDASMSCAGRSFGH
jgi:hypothetical protein